MFSIKIVNEDIPYLEIVFHSDFSLEKINSSSVIFENTTFFKEFYIKINAHTFRSIFNYFMDNDVTFSMQIRRNAGVKKKIPLKFYNYDKKHYCLLFWIISYKKLDFLYTYQKIGINFLMNNSLAILADDMGLGKTIQALLAVDSLNKRNCYFSTIIVCPNSLVANWKNEIRKWLPYSKFTELTNLDLDRLNILQRLQIENNFLIINYEKVVKLRKIISNHSIMFPLIISDEAHRLRGKNSQVASSFKKIKRKYCWLLTGTPFENNLDDIKNILSILGNEAASVYGKSSITFLNAKLKKFTLRRVKKDVLNDLPKKHKNIQFLEFNQKLKNQYLKELQKISKLAKDKKIGCFNNLLKICIENKFDRCNEIIDHYVKLDSKIVIFSFLVKPLENYLMSMTKDKRKSFLLLTGKVEKEERNLILKKFKDEKSEKKVLLISSFLGSVGLTLTNANIAIFLSEYWNPSSNLQAEDRLLRIGQKKEVKIISLRVRNSIEDNLEVILKTKENINKAIIHCLEGEEKKLSLKYFNP